MYAIITIDTTGLSVIYDEILRIGIFREDSPVPDYLYVKPVSVNSWAFAEKKNGITPQDVEDAQTAADLRDIIENYLTGVDTLIMFNCEWTIPFLKKAGFINDMRRFKLVDLMYSFAKIINPTPYRIAKGTDIFWAYKSPKYIDCQELLKLSASENVLDRLCNMRQMYRYLIKSKAFLTDRRILIRVD